MIDNLLLLFLNLTALKNKRIKFDTYIHISILFVYKLFNNLINFIINI